MSRELESWLPALDPPGGGEQRLADALARRGAVGDPAWRPALAGVSCVLMAAVALPLATPQRQAPDFTRVLDLPPPPAVRVSHGAALELPSTVDGVRVVLVMHLDDDRLPR
jgi:hypothetical protein